jgi:hypothetical protein
MHVSRVVAWLAFVSLEILLHPMHSGRFDVPGAD